MDLAAVGLINPYWLGTNSGQALTSVLDLVLRANTMKMGPLVLLLLYSWLQPRSGSGLLRSPDLVTRGALGILLALVAGRLSQILLPMRARPRFALGEALFPPTDYAIELGDWSSMPSDHAMLAASIVVAVWMVSRRLGLAALAWSLIVVCAPRVYFGVHYLSDILAGLAAGAGIALLAFHAPLPASVAGLLHRAERQAPALVILGLMMIGWETINLFATSRRILTLVARLMNGHIG
ncbi:phosphatase PAP2 family protein [Paracraurococcus ruber]|nr:phosphatase PAP2 family protein [Paracraurococcus ruber]